MFDYKVCRVLSYWCKGLDVESIEERRNNKTRCPSDGKATNAYDLETRR